MSSHSRQIKKRWENNLSECKNLARATGDTRKKG